MNKAPLALMALSCATFVGPSVAVAQVDVLHDVCMETEMRREAYDQLAADRGWERLLRIVRSNEPQDTRVWESMYGERSGGLQFWLSGETTGSDPSHATSCGLASTRPVDTWRADLQAYALQLGMMPAPATAKQNSLEAGAWSTEGPDPLSLSYDLYRSGLTLRFTRPSTVHIQ